MAEQFAFPVSDEQESSLRASAIPTSTKASTEWGFACGRNGLSIDKVIA